MYDLYQPQPTIPCPWCGRDIEWWQGKDGPNLLFVWRQHEPHPVDDQSDPQFRIDPSRFVEFSLPENFEIWGRCPEDHLPLARCHCVDGVWTDIDLTDAETSAEGDAQRRRLREWRGY
jgi:hypothetical protein